jgi:hypothetical protein
MAKASLTPARGVPIVLLDSGESQEFDLKNGLRMADTQEVLVERLRNTLKSFDALRVELKEDLRVLEERLRSVELQGNLEKELATIRLEMGELKKHGKEALDKATEVDKSLGRYVGLGMGVIGLLSAIVPIVLHFVK